MGSEPDSASGGAHPSASTCPRDLGGAATRTSSASIRVNRWPRFPPSEPLNTVRRGGLTFLQHPVLPVPPWETCLPFFSHRWKKMSEDGYPGVTPAGNNCVLRTGLNPQPCASIGAPLIATFRPPFCILNSSFSIPPLRAPRGPVSLQLTTENCQLNTVHCGLRPTCLQLRLSARSETSGRSPTPATAAHNVSRTSAGNEDKAPPSK